MDLLEKLGTVVDLLFHFESFLLAILAHIGDGLFHFFLAGGDAVKALEIIDNIQNQGRCTITGGQGSVDLLFAYDTGHSGAEKDNARDTLHMAPSLSMSIQKSDSSKSESSALKF